MTARSMFSPLCYELFFIFTGIIFTIHTLNYCFVFFEDSHAGFFSLFVFTLFEHGARIIIHDVSQPFTSLSFSFLLSFGLFRVLHSSILGKVLQIVIGQYSQ